jgi:thioredoxin family protein
MWNCRFPVLCRTTLVCLFVFIGTLVVGQSTPSFPPLEHWKTTIIAGNARAIQQLYSSEPPARVTVLAKGSTEISPAQDVEFWAGLRARRISLKVSQSTAPQPGLQEVTFQASVTPAAPGRTLYVLEAQLWQQQAGSWKLVAVQRTDTRKLEQPLSLAEKLYPNASAARIDIRNALRGAAKSHKRVLVVFGADWCYDCHVLDKAFLRPDIAPALNSNFVVVHVDVGQGDKNQDLMNEYQVPMSRGIPAIAVLDSNGKLLYSQKNGEFERARVMGPEDLLEFLNKWKPEAR